MGGYLRAMKRYAVFEGRASRSEFWQFTAVLMVIIFIALIIDGAIAQEASLDDKKSPGGIITVLVVLAHFLPSLAVTVRRLHDTNRTGFLVFLNFVPPVNLVLVILMCLRGTPGPNQHGPDPLALGGGTLTTAGLPPAAGGSPVAPQMAVAGPTRHDTIAELERLGRLRKDGHLSDAEFEVLKSEALTQARAS
ncbi:hypothetical protein AFCDBAGC_3082 [Methylobacterium cerastii]|uniref:DUF805 domain-containing protein n=1 Tax=Methylobacterium cerastii TaxID=932741 RepID=A0ABQ4QIX8_9HYPH|nr:DUF805 domain-containing protein [Methylobacterium cerastii]GJD45211.1 hypothetical protein AFCDBAGC_3082 [Methylobacterium cerastii]